MAVIAMTIGHDVGVLHGLLSTLIRMRSHSPVCLKFPHPLIQRAGRHLLTNALAKTLDRGFIGGVLPEQRITENVA